MSSYLRLLAAAAAGLVLVAVVSAQTSAWLLLVAATALFGAALRPQRRLGKVVQVALVLLIPAALLAPVSKPVPQATSQATSPIRWEELGYRSDVPALGSVEKEQARSFAETTFQKGIPEALNKLGNANLDSETSYALAAHIGASGVAGHYKDHVEALTHCDQRFRSGCARGVVTLYLRSKPALTTLALQQVCGDTRSAPENPSDEAFVAQTVCFRELGTYVYKEAAAFDVALSYCDGLDADLTRWRCRLAIFYALEQEGSKSSVAKAWDLADPTYPCTALLPGHKRECFSALPRLVVALHGLDRAAKACAAAPTEMSVTCYRTYGNEVAQRLKTNVSETHAECRKLADKARPICIFGVAERLTELSGGRDGALPLCQAVVEDDKKLCYESIGTVIHNIFWTAPERQVACARSETKYIAACFEAAERGSSPSVTR